MATSPKKNSLKSCNFAQKWNLTLLIQFPFLQNLKARIHPLSLKTLAPLSSPKSIYILCITGMISLLTDKNKEDKINKGENRAKKGAPHHIIQQETPKGMGQDTHTQTNRGQTHWKKNVLGK